MALDVRAPARSSAAARASTSGTARERGKGTGMRTSEVVQDGRALVARPAAALHGRSGWPRDRSAMPSLDGRRLPVTNRSVTGLHPDQRPKGTVMRTSCSSHSTDAEAFAAVERLLADGTPGTRINVITGQN